MNRLLTTNDQRFIINTLSWIESVEDKDISYKALQASLKQIRDVKFVPLQVRLNQKKSDLIREARELLVAAREQRPHQVSIVKVEQRKTRFIIHLSNNKQVIAMNAESLQSIFDLYQSTETSININGEPTPKKQEGTPIEVDNGEVIHEEHEFYNPEYYCPNTTKEEFMKANGMSEEDYQKHIERTTKEYIVVQIMDLTGASRCNISMIPGVSSRKVDFDYYMKKSLKELRKELKEWELEAAS